MTRATPLIAGKSREIADRYAYIPIPGQENIVSTSTAPPSRFPNPSPITVITGIKALPKAKILKNKPEK